MSRGASVSWNVQLTRCLLSRRGGSHSRNLLSLFWSCRGVYCSLKEALIVALKPRHSGGEDQGNRPTSPFESPASLSCSSPIVSLSHHRGFEVSVHLSYEIKTIIDSYKQITINMLTSTSTMNKPLIMNS